MGAGKKTVASKACNLLHSAKEIDVNESLIAGEQILNATNTHTRREKHTYTHTESRET